VREQPVVRERATALEGLTAHEPRWVCASARLKVVAVLYEVAC
jgi:hypothetical protein